MKCKKELGWKTEGLLTQGRIPHSSLTKAYYDGKWISVLWPLLRIFMLIIKFPYAEHVWFISMMTDYLSMSGAYMAHTGKECTLFRCWVMKGFFNIDYTLGSGRTPGVSILDSEWWEMWLQFLSNNADEFACIACVACVDMLKVKVKW